MVPGVPRAALPGGSQLSVCPLRDGGSQSWEAELGRHPQTLSAPWEPFGLLRALEWDVWMAKGLQALHGCWDAGSARGLPCC